jgi:D-alanine-D-alanine ligase
MNGTEYSLRKKRVGVLRGGPSREYDISLRSGAHILAHMPKNFESVDIFISRDGQWHIGGIPRPPSRILPHIDVVWNALHGRFGEDGKVQNLLQQFDIPFTGSHSFASALGMNKNLSKAVFAYHGLKTPEHTIVHPENNNLKSLVSLFQSFPQPSVIKPLSGGSSLGITLARDFNEFKKGIETALKESGAALIEEYIPGVEVSCIVIEGTDGKTLFSLIPIAPGRGKDFVFNYDLKYHNPLDHAFPSSLKSLDESAVQDIALAVHKHLGLRHYSAVDLIVHPKRGVYLLEVDTLPGLTEVSLLPKALIGHGIDMSEFINHVIDLVVHK